MPIYEYQCSECQQIFEEWQSGFEERTLNCPVCGGTSSRIVSHTSFVLKGGGWYVTDYAGDKGNSVGSAGCNIGDGDESSASSDPASSKSAADDAPAKAGAGSGDAASTTAES